MQEVDGVCTALTARGEGVVQAGSVAGAPGKRTVVPGVLPGDRVRFSAARAGRGELVAVTEASTDRVAPRCSALDRCGGCPLMAWDDRAEAQFKMRRVEAAAGLAPSWHGNSARLGFRSRARLAFHVTRRHRTLGYRGWRSDAAVAIAVCPALEAPLARGLAALREHVLPFLSGSGDIMLGRGAAETPVAHIASGAPQREGCFKVLASLVGSGVFQGIALRAGGASADAVFGDPSPRWIGYDDQSLAFPADGFGQASETMNRQLQALVARLTHDATAVLELYAGAGNLTVALARGERPVLAVERDPALVRAGKANLATRGLSATWVTADVAQLPAPRVIRFAREAGVDTLVLDPPRAGVGEALASLPWPSIRKVVYVSCEPTTLERDLAALRRLGFAIREAHALDFFPQTAHVEAVVVATRSS